MIKEKLSLTFDILEKYPETRGDGNGKFLNKLVSILYGNDPIDFETFSIESWTRSRRKVLENNPQLDNRTKKTIEATQQVLSEVC